MTPASAGFDEQLYLSQNPSVAQAVANGLFPNGWDHFIRHGYKEGRRGAPTLTEEQRENLDRALAERYWEDRQDAVYLQHIYALTCFLGRNARSIIDVGSNGCPYLDWYPWIKSRTSLDLHNPYRASGIVSVAGDFFDYSPRRKFDLALCLQVLEHIPEAESFSTKLLKISRHLIVSVPYKWPVGPSTEAMGHIHDPVDEDKIEAWFKRKPDFSLISSEKNPRIRRLICYYDNS